MIDSPDSTRRLETVSRACDVIAALDELGGAGVTEVANHVGVSKSSTHSYLSTLREKRLVVQEGDTYRLSLEFLYLGNAVRHRNVLFAYGKPVVEELAERTGEYVHLMCEQHGLERNVYKVAGENAVGGEYHTAKEQKPDYLHFTASGKAVLAALPEERVDRIVDTHGLPRKTSNTITDREELFEELSTIRSQGYAINDEEEIVGIRAVGAPIRDADGAVLGGMSVSGPTGRFTDELCVDVLAETITEKANVIEAKLNMSNASESLK
ncbi:IclR family transcriptional regulator [Halorubrum sp. DTA98]|uniref:IclR family transcriptional regulator n=1 Tax=Halorubrum sp. DTA98 TaxID=3402163 RepID=UPI003AAAAB73